MCECQDWLSDGTFPQEERGFHIEVAEFLKLPNLISEVDRDGVYVLYLSIS